MNEYRCTRAALYTHLDEPQRSNLESRNGHYIVARSPEHAIEIMHNRYPDDGKVTDPPFTAELWRQEVVDNDQHIG